MENITFSYPAWYILLCLLAGLALALGLYYRDRSFREQSKKLNPILGILRFLTGSIIAFLLLSPLIKTTETTSEKPIIVIAQDASESVALSMDSTARRDYQTAMNRLRDQLQTSFTVKTYSFGESVRDSFDFTFGDKITNISKVLGEVYDEYSHRNLGAIVLATDGIFNEGSSPVYLSRKLAVPVFSIALGDTTIPRDVFIRQVLYNKIAYLGDKMEVQVDVAAKNLAGQATKLIAYSVEQGKSKKLKEEVIPINKSDFFQTVKLILPMDKSGVQRFRFSLTPVSGERSKTNNSRDIYIEVLDARQKILILAEAPHPDIAAMRRSLSANKNYQITVRHINDFKEPVAAYDLVILHQLPSKTHSIAAILKTIRERHLPHLFVVGAKTDLPNFNRSQELVQVHATGQKPNLVQAVPAKDFSLFTLSEKLKQKLPGFNPLTAPFGKFNTAPNARVVLNQRIGKIDTDYPLWLVGEYNSTKTGVILAEGLWNWRLFDFMQSQNHDIFDELMTKTVQYLSVKEDKRKFRINVAKNLFKENEPVLFNAELYNDNYELVNTPDVRMTIIDDAGKEYPYTFSRTATGYRLNAGFFPAGHYRFKGNTSFAGKEFKAQGQFSISEIQLEKYALTADHNTLKLLADEYGGAMVGPGEIERLPELIKNKNSVKPVLYQTTRNKPLIHLHWLLGLLVLLLAVEWFLRKYYGGY